MNKCLNSARKSAVLLIAVMLIFSIFGVCNVSAASYSGKGTKSDPYLVETAEQLDGIRNNLKAHYKLANTIDLSSVSNFKPIGNLYNNTGFSGSFVCDTDENGFPKYIIKNLTVKAGSGAENVPAQNKLYKTNGYKREWEAGLFGYINGGTLTNIVIANANITNTTIGHNDSTNYEPNPGMDEMGTGVLAGYLSGAKITGCGVLNSTVTSKSNHTGGLVGCINNSSTVKNSYVTGTSISSTGLWNHGIFAGSVWNKSMVSSSCANGTLKASGAHLKSGFISSFKGGAIVKNCYATGTTDSGYSFLHITDDKIEDTIFNCYSTVNTGSTDTYTSECINGNYLLNAPGVVNHRDYLGFKPASKAEINAAFTGSEWVAGDLPTLKNVKIIADVSKYQPGAVTTVPSGDSNAQENSNSETVNSSTESEPVSAGDFNTKIEELPAAEDLILDDAAKIFNLVNSYVLLPAEDQKQVDFEKYLKLQELSVAAAELVIKEMTAFCEELPKDITKMKADVAEKAIKLYSLVENMPAESKENINYTIVKKLEEANAQALKMQEEGLLSGTSTVDPIIAKLETTLLITLIVISSLAFAGFVVFVILIIRIIRFQKALRETDGEIDE